MVLGQFLTFISAQETDFITFSWNKNLLKIQFREKFPISIMLHGNSFLTWVDIFTPAQCPQAPSAPKLPVPPSLQAPLASKPLSIQKPPSPQPLSTVRAKAF